MSLASRHSPISVADSWISHHSTGVCSHTLFKHLTAISALPGFIWTVTARSFLAGMELHVLGCSMQVVAAPVCAIPVSHALSSRSVEFHVLILLWFWCCWIAARSVVAMLTAWMNQQNVSLCWVCNVSFFLVPRLLLKV